MLVMIALQSNSGLVSNAKMMYIKATSHCLIRYQSIVCELCTIKSEDKFTQSLYRSKLATIRHSVYNNYMNYISVKAASKRWGISEWRIPKDAKKVTLTLILFLGFYHTGADNIFVVSRSGAGKTTAMKMMLKLTFPTDGAIRLFGKDYKDNEEAIYSKIGLIIETPGFYGNITEYENLYILAKLWGQLCKNKILNTLEIVGLHEEKRKVFAEYSLGMKQRHHYSYHHFKKEDLI